MSIYKLFALCFLLLFSTFSFAMGSSPKIQYTLNITDASHHLAEVEMVVSPVQTRTLEVKLPVWRSGKYSILDLAKNVRHFQAFDSSNKPLTWNKVDKNTWKIFVNTPSFVKVSYQIYANQLRDRVSHIDETHAYLDASGVFMYSPKHRDQALSVKLNVPSHWQSVSGMPKLEDHVFLADNYDQLVDSPIETGVHKSDFVQVEEQRYEIVIWGNGNYDMQRLKKDIEKLHYQAKAIWKTFPFKRYVFMYHAGDNLRGATEHVNSTIIQTDRFGFSPDKKYNRLIGTTAHEFVHTWNVKSYRPQGISPYDYNKENYSDLFWMAEGTTSFYDSLMAVRSEIYTPKQYMEFLAKDIYAFMHKPGRKVMSLAQSSFDTWLSNDENRRHNTTVSIYLKGSLVSWLLDKQIRELTNNAKSLDDLHLKLYQNFKNKGYTSYDVKQLLKQLTEHDFTEFWKNYVEGTTAIDFNELLHFYGLEFKQHKQKDLPKVHLALSTKEVNGLMQVQRVDRDGAAWKAGLTAGDKIIAIDNVQVTAHNYASHIENLKAGSKYLLHYFNQGQLKKTQISPEILGAEKFEIVPVKKPSKKQKSHFKSWTKHKLKSLQKDGK